MDCEKELVHLILQYLLENHFESKSDMARQLDIRSRTIQRAFEQLHNDKAKGSTIVLDRTLLFCAQRRISVDQLFQEYNERQQSSQSCSYTTETKHAYHSFVQQLRLPEPVSLSEENQKNYDFSMPFLRELFPFLCPHCPNWCDPLRKLDWVHKDCIMGKLAKALYDTVCGRNTESGQSATQDS